MNQHDFNRGLLDILRLSPTPHHAVANLAKQLASAGFEQVHESDDWTPDPGGRYYVIRGGSSLVAFIKGGAPEESGLRIVGAHTDSPCLKIKPRPEIEQGDYLQLGVEVYGNALLNPWFDRDLSVVGSVIFSSGDGEMRSALIDFKDPIAVIPSLAIHLDNNANESHPINKQQHLPAIVQIEKHGLDFRELLLQKVSAEYPDKQAEEVLDYDLYVYDTQPATLLGLRQDFIAGARLDNLLSCYAGMRSLLDSGGKQTRVLVCNDHEEVGSQSSLGAQGPFLGAVLLRLCGDDMRLARAAQRSMFISADNSHGVHPNYADKHDTNHGPVINKGPVIKINANQRYATSGETSALFRRICRKAGVPVQVFVSRTDLACGSTIGPITAAATGIKTVDVGVPQFAMHSVRELSGSRDAFYLYQALSVFLDEPQVTLV